MWPLAKLTGVTVSEVDSMSVGDINCVTVGEVNRVTVGEVEPVLAKPDENSSHSQYIHSVDYH